MQECSSDRSLAELKQCFPLMLHDEVLVEGSFAVSELNTLAQDLIEVCELFASEMAHEQQVLDNSRDFRLLEKRLKKLSKL